MSDEGAEVGAKARGVKLGRTGALWPLTRYAAMDPRLEPLRLRMEAAAEAGDFEEAARLRDALSLLRGAPGADPEAAIDTSGLRRQRPGAMGIGTSDQKFKPPPGWTPPRRPDPLTARVKGRKGPR